MTASQPSSAAPQVAPCDSQVEGLHPQACGTSAPPHVLGATQSPQNRSLPQGCWTVPHVAPSSEQDVMHVGAPSTTPASTIVSGATSSPEREPHPRASAL